MNICLINCTDNDSENVIFTYLNRNMIDEIIIIEKSTSVELMQLAAEKMHNRSYITLVYEKDAELLNKCRIILPINEHNVIILNDEQSLLDHSEIAYSIFNTYNQGLIMYNRQIQNNDYVVCTIDGISFVGSSLDRTIMKSQCLSNKIWSIKDMRFFYQLAHKHYDMDDSSIGYFLDIGANIGTTCISFHKKIDTNTKIIAFEPVMKNFKMLKINALLNDIDDKTMISVNTAIGNSSGYVSMNYNEKNPGASSVSTINNKESEEIKISTLSDCLKKHKIDSKLIKYIWIDTEGFEYDVLRGAIDILCKNSIPVFMEFTPKFYKKYNVNLQDMINEISKAYTKFLISEDKFQKLHSVDELIKYENDRHQYNLMLVK